MTSRLSQSLKYFSAVTLLFLSLSFLSFVPTLSFTNETDKLVLLEFKSLITNDPYGVLASWNQSSSFCNWVGVTCGHKHQRVTSLNLNRQNLRGTITPQIGNLSFLQSLNLGENFISGEIPPQLGRLLRLQELNLSFNLLQGPIPVNMSHCFSLVSLNLENNNLTHFIPPQFSSLSNLKGLYLDRNSLSGRLPASLANLSSLLFLNLTYNYMEGEIPNAIGQMKSLVTFQVGVNNFSGVFPPSLYNLSNLQWLSLSTNNFYGDLRTDLGSSFPNLRILRLGGNQFTGPLPISLPNASQLTDLDFVSNNLVGNIPMGYGKLKNLLWLAVSYNRLGTYGADHNDLGFITPLVNCTNLYWLDISHNNYGGLLPIAITNLSTQMSWLLLGRNQIEGAIPPEISNLIELTNLCFQDNLFSGNIPDSIGKLPKLDGLSLEINKLNGQIPFSLGNLTQMSEFTLQSNYLEGRIPTSLANCTHLRMLDLSDNKLNGTIPNELFGLQSLSVLLNFSYNLLSGPLPMEIEKLIFLVTLDVSNNNLTGELRSDTIGSCLALEDLYLQGNSFHGEIPNLSRLKNIKYLDLSHNNLSGPIPIYLARFSSLENLNLSLNNLEGEVPKEGVFKNASSVELYGNAKLCGGIKEFHLGPCHVRKHKKHLSTHSMVLVVSLSLGSTFLLLFTLLYWTRRLKKPTHVSPIVVPFYPKVSYKEIVKATNDFSPDTRIGSGSFGIVYKGLLSLDECITTVAIKVLNLQNQRASKSFMAECQALRNIRHRNLVKVLTVCSSMDFSGNEFKALVFEFMPNGCLEKWLHKEDGGIARRGLSFLERTNIAIDVALALQYLHHQCQVPIIHCDIKPSNVLLDDDLNAHVSDFGLARILLKVNKDTQFSSLGLRGTIGYAAPEYGMGEQVSTLGDVYSYGMLLLEMFTGKRPTDEMFKDDMNLHNFVKTALRVGTIKEIVDQSLLHEMVETVDGVSKVVDCIVSLLQVGITCSSAPRDRKSMGEIVLVLFSIRDKYLGIADARQVTIQELVERPSERPDEHSV